MKEKEKKIVETIKAYWSKGFEDETIKNVLKLSDSDWMRYVEYIKEEEEDNNRVAWMKFKAKCAYRYDALNKALAEAEDAKTKLSIVKEMEALDEKMIKYGIELGIYRTIR